MTKRIVSVPTMSNAYSKSNEFIVDKYILHIIN